jgi:large subunit ribosomal protein L21e
MPGTRNRTRDLFSRKFRQHGNPSLKKFLPVYKLGDYVDIIVDGSVHKGMPFKFYMGKTGVVRNVTRRALGVDMNKKVGNRIIVKRLNVRVEHVRPSNCRAAFVRRVQVNDALKTEANAKGVRISTKRSPILPREGFTVKSGTRNPAVTLAPRAYRVLV